MANNPILPFSVDDYFRTTGIGSLNKAITRNLYGINHRQTPPGALMNKDIYGYTFWTRPQLNMTGNNLRNDRIFYDLLSSEEYSIQRFVRTTLDPRLQSGFTNGETLSSPLVDPYQAFIPLLTNSLMSISGWPEIQAPTYTSPPGLFKEVYGQVDGTTKIYTDYDIDSTFRNYRGDPLLYMLFIWIKYASLVFEGTIVPYPDYIFNNVIDYNTRIYRLVMDHNKTYVKKIACTGVSFPTAIPIGGFFDYNSDTPFNTQMREFTIRFTSLGAEYMDNILVKEFNETVKIFNPYMRDSIRSSVMIRIPFNYLILFNNSGYPHINEETYELEWYIRQDTYATRVQALHLITNPTFTEEDFRILSNKTFGAVPGGYNKF